MSNLFSGSCNFDDDVKLLVEKFSEIFSVDEITERHHKFADLPLFWPLENVGNIPNRGTFLAGRVQSGTIKKGDKITLLQVFFFALISLPRLNKEAIFFLISLRRFSPPIPYSYIVDGVASICSHFPQSGLA